MDLFIVSFQNQKKKYSTIFFLHSNAFFPIPISVSAIGIFLIFYFLQHATLEPNYSDGALILSYIHQVSHGGLPFHDFVDLYGPLSWHLPAFFYTLAGYKVWGIRIGLVILKLITVGASYSLVACLTNRFFGLLSLCLMAVLLGQPWQFLQTAYPYHIALPLTFMTWHLLVKLPLKRVNQNLLLAAFLTTLVIWTKLNSGLFLFAGGSFYCFYWIPFKNPDVKTRNHFLISAYWLRIFQIIGIIVYGTVFSLFVAEYFNKLYFYYLIGPFLLALILTFLKVRKEWLQKRTVLFHFKAWLLYFSSTLLFSFLLQISYFGWKEGIAYWKFILGILTRMDYMAPFPPIGLHAVYEGFNEYYWTQLPWILTLLFCVWLVLQSRQKGLLVFRRKWETIYDQIGGLWILVIISLFVIYSRSDETHLFKAVLQVVPMIFILGYQIEKFLIHHRLVYVNIFRGILILAVSAGILLIGTIPSFSELHWTESVWHNKGLQFLKFYEKEKSVGRYNVDFYGNKAAEYIDNITDDGDMVLILSENQLINYNSNTSSAGGRYRFLFYLLRSELIDRETYDSIAPPNILEDILKNPPALAVGERSNSPLLDAFPELKILLKNQYELTREFNHIFIFERKKNLPLSNSVEDSL